MSAISARTAPAEMTLISAAFTGAAKRVIAMAALAAKPLIMDRPRFRWRIGAATGWETLQPKTPGTSPALQFGRLRLSRLSVAGFARQHAGIDADLLQRHPVLGFSILTEEQ